MDHTSLFLRFGIALVIGLFIGMQREFASDQAKEHTILAGVRTFALLAVGGSFAGLAGELSNSPAVLISVLSLLGGIVLIGYFISAWRGDIGMTTEVAALLTIFIGLLSYWEQYTFAAAIGVSITVLLALKLELHTLSGKISREDIFATLKFAVITAIVLPILPDRPIAFPPFDVISPYKVWLMVVFISGISFSGYVLIKLVGPRMGILLTGFLGGLASSTAVTLSFTQRSQTDKHLAKPLALAIVVAWTVMFSRVLIEVAVVNPELLMVVWLPLVASAVTALAYGLILYFSQRTEEQGNVEFSNPFELRPAITFGLLYAVVLLISNLSETYLGGTGVYLSSLLAGLTDVDAITLSLAELSKPPDGLEHEVAARGIVLAAMANTAVKGGIAIASGSVGLRKALLPGVLAMLAVGIGLAFSL
jgi:uncharacterized membrane protein (DUF4010 family)